MKGFSSVILGLQLIGTLMPLPTHSASVTADVLETRFLELKSRVQSLEKENLSLKENGAILTALQKSKRDWRGQAGRPSMGDGMRFAQQGLRRVAPAAPGGDGGGGGGGAPSPEGNGAQVGNPQVDMGGNMGDGGGNMGGGVAEMGAAAPGVPAAPPAQMQQANSAPMFGPSDWDPNSQSPDTANLKMIPFGKHLPREEGIEYLIATGMQECMICQAIISESYIMGPQYINLCGYHMRDEVNVPMCHAQARVLQSCPEFVNDWCYQDLGGTQALRSPCPDFLKCHYCLGLNPLHCMHGYGAVMPNH